MSLHCGGRGLSPLERPFHHYKFLSPSSPEVYKIDQSYWWYPWPFSFAQLNIFLAILIEGYTKVKEGHGLQDSKSILEEFQSVLTHEARRLLHLVTQGPSGFISDDRLARDLASKLSNVPKTMNRALKDYTIIALCNLTEVC